MPHIDVRDVCVYLYRIRKMYVCVRLFEVKRSEAKLRMTARSLLANSTRTKIQIQRSH